MNRPDTFRYRYSKLDGGTVNVAVPRYVRRVARQRYRDSMVVGEQYYTARDRVGAYLLWASIAFADRVEAVTS